MKNCHELYIIKGPFSRGRKKSFTDFCVSLSEKSTVSLTFIVSSTHRISFMVITGVTLTDGV